MLITRYDVNKAYVPPTPMGSRSINSVFEKMTGKIQLTFLFAFGWQGNRVNNFPHHFMLYCAFSLFLL